MPTLSTYEDLVSKIAKAKAERDKLYGSIYDPNWVGGSWMQASVNECGKAYKASEPKGSSYYPVYSDSVAKQIKCNYVIDLINDRIKLINKLDLDITAWQTELNGLLKDPKLVQDLKDQEKNRQLKNGIIIAVVVVILIIVGIVLYRKYKK